MFSMLTTHPTYGVAYQGEKFWKGPYWIGGGDTIWISRDERWYMTRWADWRLVDRVEKNVFHYDDFDEMASDLAWWYDMRSTFQARASVEGVL